MYTTETGKFNTITFFIRQFILYLFFVNLILVFFFLIGNFQGFQDKTQLLIIHISEKSSLIYLFLAFIFFIESIVEIIMLRKSSPGFLVFLFLSCGVMIPVHLLPVVTGQLFF